MLSSEIVNQFLIDIHGESGREVLLIFADYLEENGEDRLLNKLKNRKPKTLNHTFAYGEDDPETGHETAYGFGWGDESSFFGSEVDCTRPYISDGLPLGYGTGGIGQGCGYERY